MNSWQIPRWSSGTTQARRRESCSVSARFWNASLLREWYDHHASEQHKIVFENARRTGRFRDFNDDYLNHFLTSDSTGALAVGTRDYALPTDLLHALDVEIIPASGNSTKCRRMDIQHDWNILNLPNWRPITERPYWALTEDGLLRFYIDSTDTVPDTVLSYNVLYYRDTIRTAVAAGTTVDLLNPWNEGPINGAIGTAFEKQRRDPSPWAAKAMRGAHVIMPPPPEPRR